MTAPTETSQTPLILDTESVGRLTVARTELIDTRRALVFAAGVLETNPRLTDPTIPVGLQVHPGLAFCLQFNSQGRVGGPPPKPGVVYDTVHAETDLRITRPLRVGTAVTTQGRVAARRQLPPGVLNVERYSVVDEIARPLLEIDFSIMFRGAVLEGPDRDEAPRPPIPLRPATGSVLLEREIWISRGTLHHYTACSGIYAPIHTDLRVARGAGFPDIILHGSAIKSIALSVIIDAFFDGEPDRIRRLYGQLRGVVPAESSMRVRALASIDRGEERQVFFEVLNADGARAVANGFVAGLSEGGAER